MGEIPMCTMIFPFIQTYFMSFAGVLLFLFLPTHTILTKVNSNYFYFLLLLEYDQFSQFADWF